MRCDRTDHCVIDFWGACDDVGTETIFAAAERADASAGLLDHERASGGVPGLETQLPEAIDATGCDIRQVERCGAGAADAGRQLAQSAQRREVGVGLRAAVA